jgi:hypothetical protein
MPTPEACPGVPGLMWPMRSGVCGPWHGVVGVWPCRLASPFWRGSRVCGRGVSCWAGLFFSSAVCANVPVIRGGNAASGGSFDCVPQVGSCGKAGASQGASARHRSCQPSRDWHPNPHTSSGRPWKGMARPHAQPSRGGEHDRPIRDVSMRAGESTRHTPWRQGGTVGAAWRWRRATSKARPGGAIEACDGPW